MFSLLFPLGEKCEASQPPSRQPQRMDSIQQRAPAPQKPIPYQATLPRP